MTRGLEIFALIHLGLMGLSHVLQHRAWAEFFIRLRDMGYGGVFVHGFLSLGFGSMIIAFHRVWSGAPMALTICGVLYLAKTVQCFLLPQLSMHSLNRVTVERSRVFIGAGVMLLTFAGFALVALMQEG